MHDHDTALPSPQSIPDETHEYMRPDFGDVMPVADEAFESVKSIAYFVLDAVVSDFFQNGPIHGVTLYDMCSGYSVCVSDAMTGARYLEERGLIQIERDTDINEKCHCAACQAKCWYMQLPYRFDADRAILEERHRREIEAAQRRAHNIVNQQRRDQGYVYLIKCGPRYKIGITKDMARRMDQLRGQSPYPLEVIHSARGHNNAGKEATLHRQYGDLRVHGEWFELTSDQVAEIIEDLNDWARESDE